MNLAEWAGDDDQEEVVETRVGHCLHDDTEQYIGRKSDTDGRHLHLLNQEPGEPGWLGNPFVAEENAKPSHREQYDVIVVECREKSIARFCEVLVPRVQQNQSFAQALVEATHGKTLGCWCREADEVRPQCHGDVIVRVVEMLVGGDR